MEVRGAITSKPGGAQLVGPMQSHVAALSPRWRDALAATLESAALRSLLSFLDGELARGKEIFPPRPLAALEHGGPEDVRVVVLGQDPYHGPGQAHGFAFSVPEGVPLPPSLRNICVELAREGSPRCTQSGSLLTWVEQGVLLLNTVMTVERGNAGSHARKGWEQLTDALIDAVARAPQPKVFLLWGAHAQSKRDRIDVARAPKLVLEANHPSPLSARRPPVPFIGCGHFAEANRYLAANGMPTIDWTL